MEPRWLGNSRKNDWLFCYVKWKKTEITILYRNTIKTYPVLGKVRSRIGKEVDKSYDKNNLSNELEKIFDSTKMIKLKKINYETLGSDEPALIIDN